MPIFWRLTCTKWIPEVECFRFWASSFQIVVAFFDTGLNFFLRPDPCPRALLQRSRI